MVQGQREVKRGLRVARASPEQSSVCQLHSLTVSLERFFRDPPRADIKNCEGSCHFPILQGVDGNNHVMLLNSQVSCTPSILYTTLTPCSLYLRLHPTQCRNKVEVQL